MMWTITNPYKADLERKVERIDRLEREIRELRDFKETVRGLVYKAAELDEHGNCRPYRYDNLVTEIRAALNNDWEYHAPWKVVK